MKATVNLDGTISLEGDPTELAIFVASRGAPAIVTQAKRGPGRPPGRPSGKPPGRLPLGAEMATDKPKAKKPVSAERKRQMETQGKYLGFVRQLGAKDKAQVKKLAKEKGVATALELAQKLVSQKKS